MGTTSDNVTTTGRGNWRPSKKAENKSAGKKEGAQRFSGGGMENEKQSETLNFLAEDLCYLSAIFYCVQ
jgi:hypothetical protein